MYEAYVRVYMLHFLGCNILAYKSHVYIDARYIWLFINLNHVRWEYGCVALIVLYYALGEEVVFETRKLASYGYISRIKIYDFLLIFFSFMTHVDLPKFV